MEALDARTLEADQMLFGFKAKLQFSVEEEKAIAKPPTVDFGTKK